MVHTPTQQVATLLLPTAILCWSAFISCGSTLEKIKSSKYVSSLAGWYQINIGIGLHSRLKYRYCFGSENIVSAQRIVEVSRHSGHKKNYSSNYFLILPRKFFICQSKSYFIHDNNFSCFDGKTESINKLINHFFWIYKQVVCYDITTGRNFNVVILVAIVSVPSPFTEASSLFFCSERHGAVKVHHRHFACWLTCSHFETVRCFGLFNCKSTLLCSPRHSHPPLVCGGKQDRSVLRTSLSNKQETHTRLLVSLLAGGVQEFGSGQSHLEPTTSLNYWQPWFARSSFQKKRPGMLLPFQTIHDGKLSQWISRSKLHLS